MANPIIGRPDAFQPANPYSAPTGYYPGNPTPYQPYDQGWQQQPSYQNPYPPQAPQPQALMTFDDVVTKTSLAIGTVVLTAALSWLFLPVQYMGGAAMISALVGMVLAFVVMARRQVSPALVMVYAALEGVFIGVLSLIFERSYPGIVIQAVLGTFVAAGVTLAAYRYGNFRISSKTRKILTLTLIGFVAASLLNVVLMLFGINLGLTAGVTGPVGPLAWIFSLLGVGLAVFCLVDDFQYVEQGIRMGSPASESWRAAFGLTVTLVWLYTQILQILSYFRR